MRYACTDCRKKFRTEGALEMHDRSNTEPDGIQSGAQGPAQRA